MQTTDTGFTQKVYAQGHHWQDTRHQRTGRLIPALYEGEELPLPDPKASMEDYLLALDAAWMGIRTNEEDYREFRADDVPDLYRKFARLKTSTDATKRFAGSYGLLGVGTTVVIDEGEDPDGGKWVNERSVEFLHDWAREIVTMRAAVVILDLLDEGLGTNLAELSNLFTFADGWEVRQQFVHDRPRLRAGDWVPLAAWGHDDGSFELLGPDDLELAATEFVRVVANRQLAGRVQAVIVWGEDRTKTSLVYKPTSLLGAMWLQFATALTRTNTSRSCVECGKVFEFQRRNRVFCSEACQKRYGRRKAKQAAGEEGE